MSVTQQAMGESVKNAQLYQLSNAVKLSKEEVLYNNND